MRKALRQLARPHLTTEARTRHLHTTLSAHSAAAFARKPSPAPDRYADSHFSDRNDLEAELFPTWDELGSEAVNGKEDEGHWEREERLEEAIEADEEEREAPALRPAEVEEKVRPTRTARAPGTSSRPTAMEHFHEEDTKPRLGAAPPADSPIKPYRPQAPRASPQPHDSPLLSRYDWRLSSPLSPGRNRTSFDPPNLYRAPPLAKQGHNRLLGVGLEATMEARRWSGVSEEQWGWKTTVAATEKGKWESCDVYRMGQDRLVALTRDADEKNYLLRLERSGTPEQREHWGRTVNGAVGVWLLDAVQTKAASKAEQVLDETKSKPKSSGPNVVGSWSKRNGEPVGEEHGYTFKPGTILRFTPTTPEDSSSRPRPPPGAIKKHPQGTLLEMKDGKLIVSFEEDDIWFLGDEDYRIDIGLDDSSLRLQAQAIDNLYYDPARQRQRNEIHVDAAQSAFCQGASSRLDEWTLQGTEIRELVVPDLDDGFAPPPQTWTTDFDPDDDSPTAEIAHLPTPVLPLVGGASSSRSLHPSPLFFENQLIHSWIRRHQRDPPMPMLGDPELGLNKSQTQAVAMALGEKLSLIQGPPGTGKSQTIVSIIYLLKSHFRIPQQILLAAPTHVSVDHLLTLLVNAGLNPLRCGKAEKVRPELEKWTIEKRRERHPMWSKVEEAREAAEENRKDWLEWKEPALVPGKKGERARQQQLIAKDKYRKSWARYMVYEHRMYASLLATADVFCSTAVGAGSNRVMKLHDFPIVFLDEAAMCTEPVSLIPLMKGAAHVTFIGDHMQLPAVVTSQQARKERLHVSLFERLMSQQSVKSVLLDTQYRMRPAISSFPNTAFYHSALQDSLSVASRPLPPRSRFLNHTPSADSTTLLVEPLVFISHDHPEEFYRQSTLNRGEVDIIVEIVGDLLAQNATLEASDIGIISPYASQTRLLVQTFAERAGDQLIPLLGPQRASEVCRVEINTVDGFQGREKTIIILSTVRSNKSGHIGFLTDKRRLNVALTRAKDALFVVGNPRTLKMATTSEWFSADVDADAGVWRRYLGWMEERGLVRKWE